MKKKYLWAILAAALVLILVLAVTVPRAESSEKATESQQAQTDAPASEPEPQQTAEPEEEPEAETSFGGAPGELPLDTTQPKVVSALAPEQSSQPAEQGEIAPAEDPATGMELEEDELPIVTP